MPKDQHSSFAHAPAWATWAVSIVNGFVGDYLHERQNGLAIDMACYHQNRPLALTRDTILRVHPQPTAKLCLLIHGLGCHEGLWTFRDPSHPDGEISYGALLQADLGYTPFYVRYNTGLPIAENGKRLAALLDDLVDCYPLDVDEIVLIGHSMGGLVLRSACHAGVQTRAAWVERIERVFYLGSPHTGADLARLGQVATTVLHAVPNPITRLIGDIVNLRSQGVKDLRFGAPRAMQDKPAMQQRAIPWLAHAQHYFIVGTLTDDPRHVATMLFGDGLVSVPQVGKLASQEDGSLPIPPDNVKLFSRTHHLKLAYDPAVYQQIKQWCINEGK